MLHTFVIELKTLLRSPSALFWLIAFPIILSSLIQGVYGDAVTGTTTLETASVAIVRDDAWQSSPAVDTFVSAFEASASDQTESSDSRSITLFTRMNVSNTAEARKLLHSGKALAYLSLEDSKLVLTLSNAAAVDIAQTKSGGSDGQAWSLITLATMVKQYNERSQIIVQAIAKAVKEDPAKLRDASWMASLTGTDWQDLTTPVSGIRTAGMMSRYHFAILAMTVMMAVSLASDGLSRLQANLSALGARISVSPLSRGARIAAVLLSAWLATSLCMLIVYAYMHVALDVSIPGREGLAILAIVIVSAMASCLGLALGSIAGLSLSMKTGISIIVSLVLSVFTGLYGDMSFADSMQRAVPWMQYLNPAKQASNLFYDLLYYDALTPFTRTTGVIAIIDVIALAFAAFELRRSSYEHL